MPDFVYKNRVNDVSQAYLIKFVIIIKSMLLKIRSGIFRWLKYSSEHKQLHQRLDYIVYLRHCINFDLLRLF